MKTTTADAEVTKQERQKQTRWEAEQRAPSTRTRRDLAVFFLLAFVFSWLFAVPLALKSHGRWPTSLPSSLHYLVAYGPLLAALVVTRISQGLEGLKQFRSRLLKWRVSWFWWLIALSPLLFYAFVNLVFGLVQGQPVDFSPLGRLKFLPELGVLAWPFWILTFGLGEEAGWRGYALPNLQRKHGARTATLILWFFWALWHVPLFFYSYEPLMAPIFLLSLLAGAFVFTWLYNSTGDSILITAVWHGTFNLTTACVACGEGPGAALVSAAVMVWAVILLLPNMPPALRLAAGPGDAANSA